MVSVDSGCCFVVVVGFSSGSFVVVGIVSLMGMVGLLSGNFAEGNSFVVTWFVVGFVLLLLCFYNCPFAIEGLLKVIDECYSVATKVGFG